MSDITSPTRDEQIEGLRLLADFLDDHPNVPFPKLQRVILHHPANVVDFIDGLDEVPVVEGSARLGSADDAYVDLARQFAGIELVGFTPSEHVGWVTEVPATAVKFQPATPDIIRAGLALVAEGAENGDAGTAPSANSERGAA